MSERTKREVNKNAAVSGYAADMQTQEPADTGKTPVKIQPDSDRLIREIAPLPESARKEQEKLVGDILKNGVACVGKLAVFKESLELKEIDRHTLASMVERILVFEGKRIELEFSFYDRYLAMQECAAVLCKKG